MNEFPNYPNYQNFYEQPMYQPYYYQPIVPSQPQMFLKQRMHKPNLASTLRTAQKGITTATRIIPIIYQIQPVIANASTVFKVAKAMKQINIPDEKEDIDVKPIEHHDENNTTISNPYLP